MAAAAIIVARSTRRVHMSASVRKSYCFKLPPRRRGDTRPIPDCASESAEWPRRTIGYLLELELAPLPEELAPDEPAPPDVFSEHSGGMADLFGYLASSHLPSLFVFGLIAAVVVFTELAVDAEAEGAGVVAGAEAAEPSVVALVGAFGEGAAPGVVVELGAGCVIGGESAAFFSLARSPRARAEPLAKAMRVVRITAGAGLRMLASGSMSMEGLVSRASHGP